MLAALISLVLAMAGTACLLLLPVVTEVGGSIMMGARRGVLETSTVRHKTLIESQGWSAAVVLLIPVALAAAPVMLHQTRYRRTASAVNALLLTIFVVLTGFSIGVFYVPAAAAMVAAVVFLAVGGTVARAS